MPPLDWIPMTVRCCVAFCWCRRCVWMSPCVSRSPAVLTSPSSSQPHLKARQVYWHCRTISTFTADFPPLKRKHIADPVHCLRTAACRSDFFFANFFSFWLMTGRKTAMFLMIKKDDERSYLSFMASFWETWPALSLKLCSFLCLCPHDICW